MVLHKMDCRVARDPDPRGPGCRSQTAFEPQTPEQPAPLGGQLWEGRRGAGRPAAVRTEHWPCLAVAPGERGVTPDKVAVAAEPERQPASRRAKNCPAAGP